MQINYIQQVIFFDYLRFIASTCDLNTYVTHTHNYIDGNDIGKLSITVCAKHLVQNDIYVSVNDSENTFGDEQYKQFTDKLT